MFVPESKNNSLKLNTRKIHEYESSRVRVLIKNRDKLAKLGLRIVENSGAKKKSNEENFKTCIGRITRCSTQREAKISPETGLGGKSSPLLYSQGSRGYAL